MQIISERELQVQVISKGLENLLIQEPDGLQKARLATMMKTYQQTHDKRQLIGLKQQNTALLGLLCDGFLAYYQCFHELVNKTQFHSIKEMGFDIRDYLLKIQEDLKVNTNTTSDTLATKYTMNLIRLKKEHDAFSRQFLQQWTVKSKEKLKNLQNKRAKQKNEGTLFDFGIKPQPKQQIVSESLLKQNIQKPNKQLENDSKHKSEVIKSKINLKKSNELKTACNKFVQLEDYLEKRKDLNFERAKHKDITELIISKLDLFMKKAFEKILNISILSNRKNRILADQIKYFAAENEKIYYQNTFYISPNSKVFKLLYKNKLKIYSQLRSKQLEKQDKLKQALESKFCETSGKVDKIIESYIFKTRTVEDDQAKNLEQENIESLPPSETMQINTQHAIFFLQNHRYLKNSVVLFNSYHY